ncbi:MAG: hypothetical protein K8H86_12985 [Ignavibacteriaceae bacterium]|nr:hypothetical protein [Ignavibacteriaceae bacterium]
MHLMYKNILFFSFLLFVSLPVFPQTFSVAAGGDLVSRYIWRGINVNDAVNIQPSLSVSYCNLTLGVWGSYSLNSNNTADDNYAFSQEVDTWLSYKIDAGNDASVTAILTDYYYAHAGIKWGNFNNYNDANGPGAHLIEAGIILTGTKSFPLILSGYYNFYNDAGNNAYFEIAYPFDVNNVGLTVFAGAAGGSKVTPGFYGTDKFNVINLGVKAAKSVKITDEYALPVSVSFIANPRAEIVYVVFGISL